MKSIRSLCIALLFFSLTTVLSAEYSATKINTDQFFNAFNIEGLGDSLLIINGKYSTFGKQPSMFLKSSDGGQTWDSLKALNDLLPNKDIYYSSTIYQPNKFVIISGIYDSIKLKNNNLIIATDLGINCEVLKINDSIIFRSGINYLDDGSSVIISNQGLLVSKDEWSTFSILQYPEDISDTMRFVPFNGFTNSFKWGGDGPTSLDLFSYSAKSETFKKGKLIFDFKIPHPYYSYIAKSIDEQIVHAFYYNYDINGKQYPAFRTFRTTNGGNEWKEVSPVDTVIPSTYHYFGINGDSLITIYGSKILYSFDGGITWNNQKYNVDGNFLETFDYYFSGRYIYFTSREGLYRLDLTTGLDTDDKCYLMEVLSYNVRIYPIPTMNKVMVDLLRINKIAKKIELIDINGSTIYSKEICESDANTPIEMDVSKVSVGIKLIKICTTLGDFFKKIIVY